MLRVEELCDGVLVFVLPLCQHTHLPSHNQPIHAGTVFLDHLLLVLPTRQATSLLSQLPIILVMKDGIPIMMVLHWKSTLKCYFTQFVIFAVLFVLETLL